MGKRQKRRSRRKTASSGVRDALGGFCLVVMLLVLGQVAYEFAREERWLATAVTGGVMALLLLVTWLSLRQGRIRIGSGKAGSKRKQP